MTPQSFDPSRFLRKLQGQDYLEVKWRLLWLRTEHPDATISTELLQLTTHKNSAFAVMRATVSVPGEHGFVTTGHGSERADDFADFIEKAETKAIGRALGAAGFGTQFASDFDEGTRIVDSPVGVASPGAPYQNNAGNKQGAPKAAQLRTPGAPASEKQVFFIYNNARKAFGLTSESAVDEGTMNMHGALVPQLTMQDASNLINKIKNDPESIRHFFADGLTSPDDLPFDDEA